MSQVYPLPIVYVHTYAFDHIYHEIIVVGGMLSLNPHSQQRFGLDLPQTNPFSKGRMMGAKNYVAAENFVIIEAIARRKAHYCWRDDNVWRAVSMEVSNSTAHDRTPAQIADHFKKMVTAVRSAITELFVSTKLTWPTRVSIEDEDTLHAERLLYINHLLNQMTGKNGGSSKKYFSSNWWSDVVLLRLVEMINSDDGREYGHMDMNDDFGDLDRRNIQSMHNNSLRLSNQQNMKRKRDDLIIQENDSSRLANVSIERQRSDVFEEALNQFQYVKQMAENVAHSVNTTTANQKILENRLKELENTNEELKREIHRMHEILKNILSQKIDLIC